MCYDTNNIGDEIQTLAVKLLLGKDIDYYVLRDDMNIIYNNAYHRVDSNTLMHEIIYVIMNGWFIMPYNSYRTKPIFPPPLFLKPYCTTTRMLNTKGT